jgi:hypothetical protein
MKYVVEHKNSDTKKRGRKGTHNYIYARILRAHGGAGERGCIDNTEHERG